MGQWIDVPTLIWIFPIMFILHDFEEIILVENWMSKHSEKMCEKLPAKIANRVIKQFSMTTAQFAVAVLVIFLFVSISTIMANQYLLKGSFVYIYPFIIVSLIFFLHAFTHIAQSVFFGSITPGAITSVIIIIPYSIVLYSTLLINEIITRKIIIICLPFGLLFIPIVLFAHWLGKKVI